MAALGNELVVGIGGDLREAAAVPAGGGEQGIAIDDSLEPFLGRRAKLRGVVLVHHHADGKAVAQRDAPAPAAGQPADDDLSARLVLNETFVVGEVGHVLARADFRGNFQGARKEAARVPWNPRANPAAGPRSHGACESVSPASRNPFRSTRSIFARTRTRFTPNSSARSSNRRSNAGRGAL